MVKYIGFYVYHRSYQLWSPVIVIGTGDGLKKRRGRDIDRGRGWITQTILSIKIYSYCSTRTNSNTKYNPRPTQTYLDTPCSVLNTTTISVLLRNSVAQNDILHYSGKLFHKPFGKLRGACREVYRCAWQSRRLNRGFSATKKHLLEPFKIFPW